MSQEKAIAVAVERELTARGYDNYPADQELFQEAIEDITQAILRVLAGDKE